MSRYFDLGTLQTAQANLADPEVARTLDTMHDAHSVLCFENHGQDSRVREITVCPVIPSKAGTGGNNLPLVLHRPCFALDQQGGKGNASFAFEVMPTICSDSHGTPHAIAEIRRIP